MLSKEQFAMLDRDFVDSQEFIEVATCLRPRLSFVCHHNSYLVAKYLQSRGHDCQWVSGYYHCNQPHPKIRHSWVAVKRNGSPVVILEFDPRQLHHRGGYEIDPMPSPDENHPTTGVALIVDPEVVDLPDDQRKSRWIVQSVDVLRRYVQDHTLAPQDIDYDDLDALVDEAMEHLLERRRRDEECQE